LGQQLRQLGDVGGDASGFVAGEDRLPKSAARSYQDRWSNGHHRLVPMRLPAAASSVSVGDFIGEDIFVSLVDLGGEGGAVIH
jgi:hypothetical protein